MIAAATWELAVSVANSDFFDLTDWSEEERNELFDNAIAIYELRDRMSWPASDNIVDEGTERKSEKARKSLLKGRRRLTVENDASAGAGWHHERELPQNKRKKRVRGNRGKAPKERSNPTPSAMSDLMSTNGYAEDDSGRSGGEDSRNGGGSNGDGNNEEGGGFEWLGPTPKNGNGGGDVVDGAKRVVPRQSVRCIDPNANLKCPTLQLPKNCDKYNGGDFRSCYQECKKAFCCAHDSLSQNYSPSCAQTEPNCRLYFPCYIVWWKLHDTIGPANYLRIAQNEPFYSNVDFDYVFADLQNDQDFFRQLFGHHFDGDDAPTDDTFEDPANWG